MLKRENVEAFLSFWKEYVECERFSSQTRDRYNREYRSWFDRYNKKSELLEARKFGWKDWMDVFQETLYEFSILVKETVEIPRITIVLDPKYYEQASRGVEPFKELKKLIKTEVGVHQNEPTHPLLTKCYEKIDKLIEEEFTREFKNRKDEGLSFGTFKKEYLSEISKTINPENCD